MKAISLLPPILCLLASCSIQSEQVSLPADLLALQGVTDQDDSPRAWLGADVELIHAEGLAELDDLDDIDSLELQPGVRIRRVVKDSPAAQAGLRAGDTLLRFNKTDVDDPERLEALLGGFEASEEVSLHFQRGAEVREVTAKLTMRDASGPSRVLYQVERIYLRAAFSDSISGEHALVAYLAPSSPLLEAGVREGDLLLSIDGQRIGSAANFVRNCALTLEPGQEFALEVEHANGERESLDAHTWDPGRVFTEFTIWPIIHWEKQRAEGRELLTLGDLFFLSVFRKSSVGAEVEYSILGFFSWRTGEAVLESDFSAGIRSEI